MKMAARGVMQNQAKPESGNRHLSGNRLTVGNATPCRIPDQSHSRKQSWHLSTPKPPGLNELLKTCVKALDNPVPVPFRPANSTHYVLRTDASNTGWGAQLVLGGKEQLTCAQTWTPDQARKHITHKEALASALAVQHMLSHFRQGALITLQTDATSTAFAWNKGSKVPGINEPIRQAKREAARRNILVEAEHIS